MSKIQWEELKSTFVQWGKIGDYIEGTLIRVTTSQYGKVYELKALEGKFHPIDDEKHVSDEAHVIEEGAIWQVGSRGEGMDKVLANIKRGQFVKFVFAEEIPSKKKGFSPFKLVKSSSGPMDEEFLKHDADLNEPIDPSLIPF